MNQTTAVLKVSKDFPARETAGAALRKAGIDVVEASSWEDARAQLRAGAATLVVCDREAFENMGDAAPSLPRDAARALSHDLRTPLTAMSGWVHLLETGKLDQAGLTKAIARLRGNIEDQVRMIDRYLGSTQEGNR